MALPQVLLQLREADASNPKSSSPITNAGRLASSDAIDSLDGGYDAPTSDPTSREAGSATDAQATDAFAAEVLDATDGAFTTVANAIEVGLDSMTPSGLILMSPQLIPV